MDCFSASAIRLPRDWTCAACCREITTKVTINAVAAVNHKVSRIENFMWPVVLHSGGKRTIADSSTNLFLSGWAGENWSLGDVLAGNTFGTVGDDRRCNTCSHRFAHCSRCCSENPPHHSRRAARISQLFGLLVFWSCRPLTFPRLRSFRPSSVGFIHAGEIDLWLGSNGLSIARRQADRRLLGSVRKFVARGCVMHRLTMIAGLLKRKFLLEKTLYV